MAGLLKATLAARYRLLPPTTGWNEPHPAIADEGHQLRLLRQGEVWTEDRPLRAAVSSMGFGGINAHVVLEGPKSARRRGPSPRERKLLGSAQDAELLLLAADSGTELDGKLEELEAVAARISRSDLADLACRLAESNPAGASRAESSHSARTISSPVSKRYANGWPRGLSGGWTSIPASCWEAV